MNQTHTEPRQHFLKNLILLIKGPVFFINVLPVLAGFFLAAFIHNVSISEYVSSFLITLAGSALVIAGALMLNNWYEADLDKLMKRTKNRPSANGQFNRNFVLILGIAASLIGFVLLLFTNAEVWLFSFIGWFFYVVLYTFWSKQRYTWNTVIGAVSGCVTPLIGWSVVSSSFQTIPVIFALIIFFWQMPHTYSIAMRRYDDYKRAGFAMLPVIAGIKKTKIHILIYLLCLVPLPFFLTSLGNYFVGILTLLNIGWICLSIYGFFTTKGEFWAKGMFKYSVYYMMLFLLLTVGISI